MEDQAHANPYDMKPQDQGADHAPEIAIPYFSGNGHTRAVAKAISEGAGIGARTIDVEHITDQDWAILDAAEAVVFGSPTYMGSSAARFDQFLEEAADRWLDLAWADKIAAGFTVATFPSGDKLSTLQRLAIYAAQMGMIWVGQAEVGAPVHPDRPGVNTAGCWLGLAATSSRDKTQLVDTDDLETARRFGARIATATRRWRQLPS
ncbi:p-benzoquinone reductase [Roseovarius albus]|uniref:p-benzoquinone reductase n=1 Tax=Roseovarius albus TaxID=1247867 RepID=A0A1X6YJY2_9RHOB|nr:flavodoxin family protein [Roseovarius albus]SLN21865.1 p-benzoquinone reductase [Roseovarius albus]